MANISLYELDGTIDPLDKVIGTDGTNGADQGKTKNFSISGLGAYINALGVETVSTTDGTFINLTPNSQTIGDVVITADLSATGTPSASTFLRGDNTWAVPSGLGDSTTYTLASAQPTSSYVNINLSHIDEDGVTLLGVNTVKLVPGTNITLADNGSNEVTISAAAGIDGSGTVNYLPVWQDADTLTDSFIQATYSASAGLLTLGVNANIALGIDDVVGDESYRFAINGTTRLGIRETGVSAVGFLTATEYVKVGQSSDVAGSSTAGAIRYREDANNSYVEMAMKTGASTYAWVIIQQNSW